VLGLAVGNLRLGEAVDVALDGVLRVDTKALLHLVEANVHVVVRFPVEAVVLLAAGVVLDARVILEPARRTSLAARVGVAGGGALGGGRAAAARVALRARHAGRGRERRVHEGPALPAEGERVDRGVVLVREEDHGDERVGPEEVGALLEDRGVDALVLGDVAFADDVGVRVGLDEEVVPALELRLEAAAVLLHAADEAGECLVEVVHRGVGRRAFGGLLGLVALDGREPREEVRRLRVRNRRLLGAGAVDELTAVVVVRVERRVGRVRRVFGARVGAEATHGGRDDADVDVDDRLELGLARLALLALLGRRIGALTRGFAVVVDAVRRDEAVDEVGDGLGQNGLLVAHGARVVDAEEEVDLVDRGLLDGRREAHLRRRLLLGDRTRETPDAEGHYPSDHHQLADPLDQTHRMLLRLSNPA
jgi:hypothetical protein